jgi:hypothetical protein
VKPPEHNHSEEQDMESGSGGLDFAAMVQRAREL